VERQVAAHAGADGVVVASTSIAARGHLAPQPAPNYRHHTDCAWALLYIERWLKAPVQMADGTVKPLRLRRPLRSSRGAHVLARERSRQQANPGCSPRSTTDIRYVSMRADSVNYHSS
jgi:hypothetical protein